ncbi:hypothetical protein JCM10212_001726 [Sporobolomyces blumeae]
MSDAASPATPKLKPGEVLGPDGKPCKVCTGFQAWTGGTKKKKQTSSADASTLAASSGATAALASSAAAAATASTSDRTLPDDCPADVERLGRHTWTFLHTTASYFAPTPTAHQQSSMLSLLRSLPTLYPCGSCADHLGTYMERDPPEKAVGSREAVEAWMCRAHNEVNERLGKDRFDCANVGQRWRDGWDDGRCD